MGGRGRFCYPEPHVSNSIIIRCTSLFQVITSELAVTLIFSQFTLIQWQEHRIEKNSCEKITRKYINCWNCERWHKFFLLRVPNIYTSGNTTVVNHYTVVYVSVNFILMKEALCKMIIHFEYYLKRRFWAIVFVYLKQPTFNVQIILKLLMITKNW